MLELFVKLQNRVYEVRTNERGASGVEYGLLVALIAAVIVAIVATLGTRIASAFSTVVTSLGSG